MGDRYGPRKMMILGAVSYAAAIIIVAFIDAPWHLFISFGIMRGAVQAIFMVPLMAAVTNWFKTSLGLGTGILWAASGIGPAIMSPLLSKLLVDIGWQSTFVYIGLFAGVFILFMALFFRNRPDEMGMTPFGTRVLVEERGRLRAHQPGRTGDEDDAHRPSPGADCSRNKSGAGSQGQRHTKESCNAAAVAVMW